MTAAVLDSPYDDGALIDALVAAGRHRDAMGGLWDEIGRLQLEFLTGQGLQPGDHLLDVGCGCLRAGVHLAAYLAPGHYWGIDRHQSLLDAGRTVELAPLGLAGRVPADNLLCDDEFRVERLGRTFDMALAQSLFTHLPANRIRLCLARLAGVVRPGGRLFASFLPVPDGHPVDRPCDHRDGIRSWSFKDPFHASVADLEQWVRGMPWRIVWTGAWGHPRGQYMAILERLPQTASPAAGQRALPADDAQALEAGAGHYRAYVGPPDRFDFMSATQFALLFALGLREHHTVLDFGCGSLRLGRLLMPYLAAGRYHGIDPNRWLIEDALSRELGQSILPLKQPRFAYNADFSCGGFGRRFDFIVAQSILTHCGRTLTRSVLAEFAAVLDDAGIALFTILETTPEHGETVAEGWIYPTCVHYHPEMLLDWCRALGLHAVRLPWYHPVATWYAAARRLDRLPTAAEMPVLSGSVLFDPQFAASRPKPT